MAENFERRSLDNIPDSESGERVEHWEDFNLKQGDRIFSGSGKIRQVNDFALDGKDMKHTMGYVLVTEMTPEERVSTNQRLLFKDLVATQGNMLFIDRSDLLGNIDHDEWSHVVRVALFGIEHSLVILDSYPIKDEKTEQRRAELLRGKEGLQDLLARKVRMDAKAKKKNNPQ